MSSQPQVIPVVGVIGGIGSGKSSVTRRLRELSLERRRVRSATRIPNGVDGGSAVEAELEVDSNASRGATSPTGEIAVIDADQLGHQVLLLPNVKNRIRERFGDAVFEPKESTQRDTQPRSHAPRGNANNDALRHGDQSARKAITADHDAERRDARSHAERGNEIDEISRSALARIVFGNDDAAEAARRDLERIVHPEIRSLAERQIRELRQRGEVAAILLDAAVLLEAGWNSVCDLVAFIDTPDALRLARVQAGRGWSAEELAKREASQWPLARKRAAADVVIDNSGSVDDAARQLDEAISNFGVR